MTERDKDRRRIRDLIAELNEVGLSAYKLSLMLSVSHNTIAHWADTGRLEAHDEKRLIKLHQTYCRKPAPYSPQYVTFERKERT